MSAAVHSSRQTSRLYALLASWPLVSENAFQGAVTRLDGETARELWKEAQVELVPRARGLSFDAIEAIAAETFLRTLPGGERMHEYIGALGRRWVSFDGVPALLERDRRGRRDVDGWRLLSLAIPAELLTAHANPLRRGPPMARPSLCDWLLDNGVLARPFAVTHLHMGAAMDFHTLFTSLMQQAARPEIGRTDLKRGGDPPFGTPDAFRERLLQAALARLVLAGFLRRAPDLDGGSFDAACSDLRALLPGARPAWRSTRQERVVRAGIEALARPRARGPAWPALRAVYFSLVGPSPLPSTLEELYANDPIADRRTRERPEVNPEIELMSRAAAYLDACPEDEAFARLYWQYQRVRCRLFGHLVEFPGTAGLEWFSRHYHRISAVRGGLERALVPCAFDVEGRGLSLGSLEVRTSPPSSAQGVTELVQSVARAALAHAEALETQRSTPAGERRTPPEVGLVLHLVKKRGGRIGGSRRGRRFDHGDPAQPGYSCRYGAWHDRRLIEARAIATAIRRRPELLVVLRGLDVANLELAIPTWVLLRPLQIARDASRQAAARPPGQGLQVQLEPLRQTLHVGEDFVRLSEGLRRIHEALEFGVLGAGDRIGHATALGLDPARWAQLNTDQYQAAEDRLEDLLWELELYRTGDISSGVDRAECLRREILDLGDLIYACPEHLHVEALLEARSLRFSPPELERLGYPRLGPGRMPPRGLAGDQRFTNREAEAGARRLLLRQLCDSGVYRRGRQPVRVRSDEAEVRVLAAAQEFLRSEVAARDIVVETNPSSNLLIAGLSSLDEHPSFRLRPLPGQPRPGTTVPVTISSDNPLTFATNLADEVGYLYGTLLEAGVGSEDAIAWIEGARQTAWSARFTLAASREPEVLRAVAAPRRPTFRPRLLAGSRR